MSFLTKIVNLTRMFYPTGRAYNTHSDSNIMKLHSGLSISENQAVSDSLATLDVILPDNDNFTADDASRWEQRLGLITNTAVSLADRKLAILRKMNHPGTILARQSAGYLQDQLQLAGFNVYVHENPNGLSIVQLLGYGGFYAQLGDGQLGDFQLGDVYSYYSNLIHVIQLGDGQLGGYQLNQPFFNGLIANHIDESLDANFNIGLSNSATFVVGGPTLGSFANVDVNRKDELRQLILKIKPVQTVGFLFTNYN